MSYRFVKISSFYSKYLENYRDRYSEATPKTYQESIATLLKDSFSWADFYSLELKKLGVDAREIVTNFDEAQNLWAKEHGVERIGYDLVCAQLKDIQPDVVFLQDLYPLSAEWIRELRGQIPSIRLILGWCSTPFANKDLDTFRELDAIFCCTPGYVQIFKNLGLNAFLLNHAFAPQVLERLQSYRHDRLELCDFSFMGSLLNAKDYHRERIRLVESLLKTGIDLKVFSDIRSESAAHLLARQMAFAGFKIGSLFGGQDFLLQCKFFKKVSGWSEFPRASSFSTELRKVIQKPLFGLEMFAQLQKSKVAFNNHIDASSEYAGNIRLYEVTGMGSCLVTDWKPNLKDLFEPDREVVAYKNLDECLEKVKWLLAHPAKCAEIALAGQKRCHKDHSFRQRAEQLHDWICQHI